MFNDLRFKDRMWLGQCQIPRDHEIPELDLLLARGELPMSGMREALEIGQAQQAGLLEIICYG